MFYVIDFAIASIDKAINNVSKRIYATALLKEFGVIGTPSETYELVSDYNENILIQQIMKSNIFSKLRCKSVEKFHDKSKFYLWVFLFLAIQNKVWFPVQIKQWLQWLQRFWIRKIFWKTSLSLYFFKLLSDRQGYFFFDQWFLLA